MAISPNLNRLAPLPIERETTTQQPISASALAAPSSTAAPAVARPPVKPAPEAVRQTPATSRRTTIDQTTGELVLHVIDTHSGQQVSQSPDEAMLRIRAYARQMDAAHPGTTTIKS